MADSRRQILDACLEIISKEGVRQLSFREVARRAGVSHQAPYHYFEDQKAILRAIAEEGFNKLTEFMKERSDQYPDDAIKALTASGLGYVDFAISHPGHFRVMFQNSLLSAEKKPKPLPESAGGHDLLVELVKRARKQGISIPIPTEELVLLCWSIVHGVSTLFAESLVESDSIKAREAASHAVVKAFGKLLEPS